MTLSIGPGRKYANHERSLPPILKRRCDVHHICVSCLFV